MKTIIISLFSLFLFLSCSEDNLLKPYGPQDSTPPGRVDTLSTKAIPGGVVIKYKAPADEDLMYIKVKYTLDNGKEMEARGSVYSDTLVIEGFGRDVEREISLSAVDRFENEGLPTVVKVMPGRPAYLSAFESLASFPTFGGIKVSMQNESKNNLIVDVMTTDTLGEWYSAHTEYTSQKDIAFFVRGFDSIPRIFGITVRDPWKNISEVKFLGVKPFYEKQLEREKFKKLKFDKDVSVDEWGLSMEQLWSGQVAWGSYNMCHTIDFGHFPQWFTFDMGATAILGRYRYWQRLGEDYIYQHGNLETWELWGRADYPEPGDPADGGWVLLSQARSIKPSGLPVGAISAEDIEYATNGEDFEILSSAPVRYIRFKALSTFSGQNQFHIQQLWFWGTEVKE